MNETAVRLARALRSGEIQVTRLVEGSGVLLHRSSLASRRVNPTGMLLVDALRDGADDLTALAAKLSERHGIDAETAALDANRFVSGLATLLDASR